MESRACSGRDSCSFTPTFQSEQGVYSERENVAAEHSSAKESQSSRFAATNRISKASFATTS